MTALDLLLRGLLDLRRELLAQCRDDDARALVARSLEAASHHVRAAVLAARRAP